MDREKERRWERELAVRACVVGLVKGRLGCACPEEVFDRYQVRQRTAEGLPLVELIVGERLLVWVMAGDRIEDPPKILGQPLREGTAERDLRALNRFRLVVMGGLPSWEREWGHLAEGFDSRVHLHVLPDTGSLPGSDPPSPSPLRQS